MTSIESGNGLWNHVINVTDLQRRGWVLLKLEMQDESAYCHRLERLAGQLGRLIRRSTESSAITTLRPIDAHVARRRSLSRQFSLGRFPFHIDTAHWPMPCRYVVMACVIPGAGNRPSLLLDTKELPLSPEQSALLEEAPLRIRNGRHSFFGTILRKERPFVRYDPGCMEAVSRDGAQALGVYSSPSWRQYIAEVRWEPGMAVVIDNWRVLHARGDALRDDRERTLVRILVE
jgi:hypothetical protein